MLTVQRKAEQTGNYHIMEAPSVMAALVLRKLRVIEPQPNNTSTPLVIKYLHYQLSHQGRDV